MTDTKYCVNCGAKIDKNAALCVNCGVMQPGMASNTQKNEGLAAVLSFLISGLGQIYNGQIGKGIGIFVLQIINFLLMFILIGFLTYLIVWVWSVYDAYTTAKKINEGGI